MKSLPFTTLQKSKHYQKVNSEDVDIEPGSEIIFRDLDLGNVYGYYLGFDKKERMHYVAFPAKDIIRHFKSYLGENIENFGVPYQMAGYWLEDRDPNTRRRLNALLKKCPPLAHYANSSATLWTVSIDHTDIELGRDETPLSLENLILDLEEEIK